MSTLLIGSRRQRHREEEQAKVARLEIAERDLRMLQRRERAAVRFLDERHKRNHWREAIEQLMGGAR